ncbi:MAG: hypothetical protein ABI947_00215 [Chloroflexota bacterium]
MQRSKFESLRPSTMLEVLDRTFRIYRDNFATFIALVAPIAVIETIINVVNSYWLTSRMSQAGFNPNSLRGTSGDTAALNAYISQVFGALFLTIIITLIGAFIQGVLINGPLTYIVSERNLGRSVTVRGAFNAVRGKLGKLAGGLFLYYVIIVVLTIGLAFTLFLCGLGVGILVYIIVALHAFLAPVLILENVSISQGMSRAWSLAKSRFWPVFGLTAAVTIISYIIAFALSTTGSLVTNGTIAPASFGVAQVVRIVLNALVAIVLAPVLPIGYTLLYYDARIRLEGLDIALQNVDSAAPRPSDLVSPPPVGSTFSRDDLINMGILVAGMFILVLLYFFAIYSLVGSVSQF